VKKNKAPSIPHSAANPDLLWSSARAGSPAMKSIVVSASEFTTATTNSIGASCIGPSARARSSIPPNSVIARSAAARVSGVMSSEAPSRASARLWPGFNVPQRIQFDHAREYCSRTGASAGIPSSEAAAIPVFSSRYSWLKRSAFVSK
jgi:hypothetical protein